VKKAENLLGNELGPTVRVPVTQLDTLGWEDVLEKSGHVLKHRLGKPILHGEDPIALARMINNKEHIFIILTRGNAIEYENIRRHIISRHQASYAISHSRKRRLVHLGTSADIT
jgi:hypothetical protein